MRGEIIPVKFPVVFHSVALIDLDPGVLRGAIALVVRLVVFLDAAFAFRPKAVRLGCILVELVERFGILAASANLQRMVGRQGLEP